MIKKGTCKPRSTYKYIYIHKNIKLAFLHYVSLTSIFTQYIEPELPNKDNEN
jgi:hypothetical protein